MDKDGRWLEHSGSEDSHGRALWSLGHVIKFHPSLRVRQAAQQVLRAASPPPSASLRRDPGPLPYWA
jgi:hypothetical protein